jgi:hypothetical protein
LVEKRKERSTRIYADKSRSRQADLLHPRSSALIRVKKSSACRFGSKRIARTGESTPPGRRFMARWKSSWLLGIEGFVAGWWKSGKERPTRIYADKSRSRQLCSIRVHPL